MPIAVITFDFDPLVHLGDRYVRWETLGVAAAILLALLVAGLIAGRVIDPADVDDLDADADDPEAEAGAGPGHLRRDDLLLIVLGIVPGAVIGGRVAYVALHLDYFRANSGTILDPASGGLSLSGAVLLGALTGSLIARLFGTPLGRWFRVAAVPMLLALGLGKAALILGGTGQGLPSELGWATRYLGPGPWGSLGPEIPSHPAQAYEAIGVGIVLVEILGLWRLGAFRAGDGRAFALALGGWATVRFAVAATWRDPAVLGSLGAEQLLDVAIVVISVAAYLVVIRRTARARRAAQDAEARKPVLSWPDPETRKQF